jgi:hypothetical protein
VLKKNHKFRGSISFPLMSKGESYIQGGYCNKGGELFLFLVDNVFHCRISINDKGIDCFIDVKVDI